MLNIVTVNWQNYEGRGVEYVNNLFDSVRRNLEEGFEGRFIVFTDNLDDAGYRPGIELRWLHRGDLRGWWNKLYLFKSGVFDDGDRIVFLDLDTLIVGPIDRLAAYDGDFAILQDFYRPTGLQSSVMAWEAGEQTEIWESFERAGCPMADPGGDQAWIERVGCLGWMRRWQTVLPGMFVSYKQTKGIPSEASVVIFHGKPRPHEVTEGWVPKVWCEGGISHAELKAVCNTEQEALLSNVRSASKRDLKWFEVVDDEHDGHVAIIGGGPSVRDMIEEIQYRQGLGQAVWVLNNAAVALKDTGISFDAQILLDARPDNAKFITGARQYMVASQCDALVFDGLHGREVTLFHVNSPGMAEVLKDEKSKFVYLVGGGTTVGMNALALAFLRGYRKIHLYGFDSCYRNGEHHAYAQPLNDSERVSEVLYNNKTYICAPWMVGQAQEFMELAPVYEADGTIITVHGKGLLQDISRDISRIMTPAQQRAHEILSRIGPGACGVEVGVFAGQMSAALLRADPALRLVMVDSWEGAGAAYIGDSGDWHATLTDASQWEFKRQTMQRVKFAGDRSYVIEGRSVNSASWVPDSSQDFVFLDADHSYEGCKRDLAAWSPKIKPGGWLGGHDYQNAKFEKFGVTRAVDEFAAEHSLQLEIGGNFCWFVQIPQDILSERAISYG